MKKAVILNDTSGFHHGCDIVMKNIVLLLKLNDIEVIANNNVSTKWTENKLFLNACQNADIAIINGEGSIHHNVDNAIYILSFAKYIKECCGGGTGGTNEYYLSR